MNTSKPALLAALAVCLFASVASAETYTWVGGATSTANWNEPTNWSPEGVPTGGDTARIVRGSDNVALTIAFTSDFAVNGGVLTIENRNVLTFSGVISGNGGLLLQNYGNATITGDNTFSGAFETIGSGVLTLKKLANAGQPSSVGAGTGTYALVKLNCGELSITDTCSTDRPVERDSGNPVKPSGTVTLNGAYDGQYFGRAGGTVVFNGPVSLSADLKRTDFGTTKLTDSSNAFTTKVVINAGTLVVTSLADGGQPSAAGAGTDLQFDQQQPTTTAYFKYDGTVDAHCDRTITVDPYNGSTYANRRGFDFENRTAGVKVTFSGPLVQLGSSDYPFFYARGVGDGEYAGSLGGKFNFHKAGTGYWVLSGVNAHSGTTVVSEGRLDVTGSTPATSAVEAQGTGTLGGTGTILGSLSIASGATLAAGTASAPGTLTVAGVSLASGSKMSFRLGGAADDAIAAAGAFAVSGSVAVRAAAAGGGTIPDGTYTLVTYPSTTATPASFVLDLPGGETGELEVGSTALRLRIGARNDILVWKGDGVANELSAPANWQGGSFDGTLTLEFDDTGDASVPVHLSADVTPAAVRLSANATDYTFAGAGFAGSGYVLKSGAGAVVFTNANSFTGGYSATAGATALDGTFAGTSIQTLGTATFAESASGVISGTGVNVSFGPGGATLAGDNSFTGTMEFNARAATADAAYTIASGTALGNIPALDILLPDGTKGVTLNITGTWTNAPRIDVRDGAARSGFTLNSLPSSGDKWLKGGIVGHAGGSAAYPTMIFSTQSGTGSVALGDAGGVALSGFAAVTRRGTPPARWYGNVSLPAGATFLRNDQGLDEFHSPSNAIDILDLQQGIVRCCADDAFGTNTVVKIGKNSLPWGAGHDSRLDLNGHDLTLKAIVEQEVGNGGSRQIESQAPATLTVWSDDVDSTFGSHGVYDNAVRNGEIRYAVSIVKKGAATFTLSGTNSFTGTVSVEGGVLATTSACALPATTALYLGKKDGSAGVVRLDASQTVDSLYIDGIGRRSGVYGGPDSAAPADNRLACFAGTGVLTVLTGKARGFVISIR